jgi:N-acetylmuramic acid 6-phosphate etherase
MTPLSSPPTEGRSVRSHEIDRMGTADVLRLINEEDSTVPTAVRAVLPALVEVVERAVIAVRAGGRIHYFGAGTSGRFGVLDAAEVPPTYGVSADLVVAHMAGGDRAMNEAVEDAEDSEDAGKGEARNNVDARDIVFGLAASGRTPYVAAALREARARGAFTVAVSSNPAAPIAQYADVHLCVDTGQEVVTGSTRMKAGTAQKLILHSFSTALMIRLGRTFSNLMIDVVPTNEKLRLRVVRLLGEASGASDDEASMALQEAQGDTKTALVMLLTGVGREPAREQLAQRGGSVRATIDRFDIKDRDAEPGNSWMGVDIGASGFRINVLEGATVTEITGLARPTIRGDIVHVDAVLDEFGVRLHRLREQGIATDIDGVVIGLAGYGFFPGSASDIARRVRTVSRARAVAVGSDLLPAFVGAIGLTPGAVLAAGTGAVSLGTDLGATFRRVDGLGHLLGDHGSGAWIGRRALQAALAGHAGQARQSAALEAAATDRFGDLPTLVADIYGIADRSALLASFVPDVIEVALSGDLVAMSILDDAAAALAWTLTAAGQGIAGPRAAVGGLVTPGSEIRARLEHLVELAPSIANPAEGGAIIARHLRAGTLPAVLQSQLSIHE